MESIPQNKYSTIKDVVKHGKFFSDPQFLIEKAKKDLDESSTGNLILHTEKVFDFVNTLFALEEWCFYSIRSNTMLDNSTLTNFKKSIDMKSAEVKLVRELANTFKHHTRRSENSLLCNIGVLKYNVEEQAKLTAQMIKLGSWIVLANGDKLFFLPFISDKKSEYYMMKYIFQKALDFLKSLVSTSVVGGR